MTQSVLESMARAIARVAIAFMRDDRTWGVSTLDEDVEGAWPDYVPEARAALIALRDGVTGDQATIEATLSDSEYGYGSFLEPFQAALNHVLQEGEKDTESAE